MLNSAISEISSAVRGFSEGVESLDEQEITDNKNKTKLHNSIIFFFFDMSISFLSIKKSITYIVKSLNIK